MSDAYTKAGVDIDAGKEAVARYQGLIANRQDPRIIGGIGGFGGCFALAAYKEPVLVASTDGVGTKVIVAAQLQRFDSIGRDLVHHCINDIVCANAQPLFFLDYLAVAKLDPGMAAAIVEGVAGACAENDIALLGGETAEMPGVYEPGLFDVAGTIVGVVERAAMIDTSRVVAGDAILGLPANGFHTNGYSLVRRILPPSRWAERLNGSPATVGDALAAVHPSYLPYIRALARAGIEIKAMAHITGGGLLDNVPRVLPTGLAARFFRSRIAVPPVMALVVRDARLDDETAYRTFNMGVGFCAIVAARDAERAVAAANAALSAQPISGASPRAVIVGDIEPCGPAAERVIIA